jgi:hypothetical protein
MAAEYRGGKLSKPYLEPTFADTAKNRNSSANSHRRQRTRVGHAKPQAGERTWKLTRRIFLCVRAHSS